MIALVYVVFGAIGILLIGGCIGFVIALLRDVSAAEHYISTSRRLLTETTSLLDDRVAMQVATAEVNEARREIAAVSTEVSNVD